MSNTSSGKIEAGLLDLLVRDLRDWKKGRLHGANVGRLADELVAVVALLVRLGLSLAQVVAGTHCGDDTSGPWVARIVLEAGRKAA